jgi:SRSO17 transposase
VIDEYYLEYTNLFKEVKNYEYFQDLHLGKISPIKRKSLLKVAKGVSIKSGKSLHNFITNLEGSLNK